MYSLAVTQANKMLANTLGIMQKAEEFAASKKIDVNVFVQDRLAMDQLPFVKQIQIASDSAKFMAARLSATEPPKFEDNETTWPELKTRIQKTIDFIKTCKAEKFQGWEERRVPIGFMPGKYVIGAEYLHEMAMPNLYFHITTAYSILRHRGVPVGKMDYLGNINFKDL
jgi:hypothetical protein